MVPLSRRQFDESNHHGHTSWFQSSSCSLKSSFTKFVCLFAPRFPTFDLCTILTQPFILAFSFSTLFFPYLSNPATELTEEKNVFSSFLSIHHVFFVVLTDLYLPSISHEPFSATLFWKLLEKLSCFRQGRRAAIKKHWFCRLMLEILGRFLLLWCLRFAFTPWSKFEKVGQRAVENPHSSAKQLEEVLTWRTRCHKWETSGQEL